MNALEISRFWNRRAERYGHTGWKSHSKYAFDQPARIKAMMGAIDALSLPRETALDFGCGTGDFSTHLAKRFADVVACDISESAVALARHKNQGTNIQYRVAGTVEELGLRDGTINLVMCVTVLGHIMNDPLLSAILRSFHQKLKPDGCLIAMEYAPRISKSRSAYQRLTTFSEWRDLFQNAGFGLRKCYGFHHPQRKPAGSYLRYRFHPKTLLWSLFQFSNLGRKKITSIAEKFVMSADDLYWECGEEECMRVMVFQKS